MADDKVFPAAQQPQSGWLRLPPIHVTFTGPVTVHAGDPCFQEKVLQHLTAIEAKENKIMSQLSDAMDALTQINDATTKQGTALQSESDSLQKVSDNLTQLIANAGTNVPQPVLDGLKAQASAVTAISDSIQKHADFAAQLASQGVATPVPVTPPDASPAPAPVV